MAFDMPMLEARFTSTLISKLDDLRAQVYFTRTRVEIHSLIYLQDPVVQMFYYVNVSLRECWSSVLHLEFCDTLFYFFVLFMLFMTFGDFSGMTHL
jgi:hypothetical protein